MYTVSATAAFGGGDIRHGCVLRSKIILELVIFSAVYSGAELIGGLTLYQNASNNLELQGGAVCCRAQAGHTHMHGRMADEGNPVDPLHSPRENVDRGPDSAVLSAPRSVEG